MAEDLFVGDQPETVVADTVTETIIGENGQYKTVDAAAKALAEKEKYIKRLEAEAAERNAVLQKRINEEEFLDRMERLAAPKSPEVAPQENPRDEGPAVTLEAVEEVIQKREAKKLQESNLSEVQKTLSEVYGPDWKARVQAQARELGVGTDYLTSVAAKSPKAFYATMGITQSTPAPKKADDVAPPRSSVTPLYNINPSAKDYAYWQEQRQQKGERWYFSIPVQQNIWRELKAQGEEKFHAR